MGAGVSGSLTSNNAASKPMLSRGFCDTSKYNLAKERFGSRLQHEIEIRYPTIKLHDKVRSVLFVGDLAKD